MVKDLLEKVERVSAKEVLNKSSVRNMKEWVGSGCLPEWAQASLSELIDSESWEELNDRFFDHITFGTGGMRGRTVGKVVTSAEGSNGKGGEYKHAGVGTSMLNDFNIIRATIGLFQYSSAFKKSCGAKNARPRLVIAHDVRHFSRHFCMLAASTWTRLGGEAMFFDGPRSTPQLSFSVRYLNATAGIVITASHNPPHDNGYKVYFQDGGQVVSPHAEGIISKVKSVGLKDATIHLEIDDSQIIVLGEKEDEAYLKAIESGVMDPELIHKQKPKVVFTPIHGTGAVASLPLMKRLGVDCCPLEIQMVQDPDFVTVRSPNPENPEALMLAVEKADNVGAELVIGTDPDADRMGVAVRRKNGDFVFPTGNQIASVLTEYKISKLKEIGWLPQAGTKSAAIIKTFVTTPLIDAIAKGHGLKVINTLTGFKWIGSKIKDYEDLLVRRLDNNKKYDSLEDLERAQLLIKYSTFFVFGGEESYGYLSSDKTRDKDANAAAILFCELAADLKSKGITFEEYLDDLYLKYGYFQEGLLNINYEGASGVQKIQAILSSYKSNPPTSVDGIEIVSKTDFSKDVLFDDDGKRIPSQDFFLFELSNGYKYAVRGSGTEPKIKFYLFANEKLADKDSLGLIKEKATQSLEALKKFLEFDARGRAGE